MILIHFGKDFTVSGKGTKDSITFYIYPERKHPVKVEFMETEEMRVNQINAILATAKQVSDGNKYAIGTKDIEKIAMTMDNKRIFEAETVWTALEKIAPFICETDSDIIRDYFHKIASIFYF